MENNKKVSCVVFLDVDGVLNTRKTCERTPSGLYYGVDGARVELLAIAMKHIGAEGVVLTTTWKDMQEGDEDYLYLLENLKAYGIEVVGKTKEERFLDRAEGIVEYLKLHPEIEEFVILDDRHFDFDLYDKLWESYIDTQARGIEYSIAVSATPSVAAILFLDAIEKNR